MKWQTWMLVGLIAFIAGLGGVIAGQRLLKAEVSHESALHALIHNGLELSAAQKADIDALERRFSGRREALEAQMRSRNAQLAAAIQAEHGDGPRVRAAVDAVHIVMGDLQKETLAHVFAMRRLLRPDQAAKFDRAITGALTQAPVAGADRSSEQ